jgi:hypothetical protein
VEVVVAPRRKLAAARPDPARAVRAKKSRRVDFMMRVGQFRGATEMEIDADGQSFEANHVFEAQLD